MNKNLFHAGGSNTFIGTVVPYLFHTNPLSLTFTINFSLLMTYVECTETLMIETDLVKVVNSTFGGFLKMLNEKSFS